MNNIPEINNKIEKEFKEIVTSIKEEIVSRTIYKKDHSYYLILGMMKKEESLLNCLCKIKYSEALNYVIEKLCIQDFDDEDMNEENNYIDILREANEISIKDNLDNITDEHILYAILKNGKSKAISLLEDFNVNTDMMLLTVNDYLELEEESFVINITEEVKKNKVHEFIGREEYIDKIIRILFKKQKNNCMLIGPAGVGKTALVEGVAKKLIEYGYDENIYRLEIGQVISGTRYRGDLEERIINVINKIKENKGILFIDEIQTIMGSNKGEETLSIGNMIKPMLSRSEIKCIGATTLEEYYNCVAKDKAFVRRFQKLIIPEPNDEETLFILKKIKHLYEEYYGISYKKDILKKVVASGKYFPNLNNPDKSIDLLDELGALASNKNIYNPNHNHLMMLIKENLGIRNINNKKIKSTKVETLLMRYFNKYLDINNKKNTILNISYYGKKEDFLIKDIKEIFSLLESNVIEIDISLFDEYLYNYLLKTILESPICLIVIKNFDNASYALERKIIGMIQEGKIVNYNNQVIYLFNTIFLFLEKENSLVGFNSIGSLKEKEISKKNYIDEIITEKDYHSIYK